MPPRRFHTFTICSPPRPSRLALDLVENYFQIVHTRFPLLNPDDFRNRFQSVSFTRSPLLFLILTSHFSRGKTKSSDLLHPALVATVIAWGAKFSENTLFVADRQRNGGTKSLFAITLVDRARELAELLKVHRISTSEHVIIGLLLEPLQSRQSDRFIVDLIGELILAHLHSENPEDPLCEPRFDSAARSLNDAVSDFHRFWLISSVRSLINLQVRKSSVSPRMNCILRVAAD